MNQLYYILITFAFIGCVNNKTSTENHIQFNTEVAKEDSLIDAYHNDYKILPIDESGSDPSLVEFINDLKAIVTNRDTAGLFKSLNTAIIVSHGGGIYGIKEFSNYWKLDQPDKSELWTTLDQIIHLGGTWENDVEGKYFCIPYTQSNKAFSRYEYDFEWYFTAVCISSKASVYKEPNQNSEIIGTLQYDIVEMNPDFMKPDFTKIHTIDKTIDGYVKTKDLIYSADQYLVIKKIDNKWKITAFAPYD